MAVDATLRHAGIETELADDVSGGTVDEARVHLCAERDVVHYARAHGSRALNA